MEDWKLISDNEYPTNKRILLWDSFVLRVGYVNSNGDWYQCDDEPLDDIPTHWMELPDIDDYYWERTRGNHPDCEYLVLLYDKNHGIFIGYIEDDDRTWQYQGCKWKSKDIHPILWMELPEPPEDGVDYTYDDDDDDEDERMADYIRSLFNR